MIDKNLNLVKELDNGITVHHALISYGVYKQNYLLLNKVASHIMMNGLLMSAPTIAAFALNDLAGGLVDLTTATAKDIDLLHDDDIDKPQLKKQLAFVSELKRLTNVIVPTSGSYDHKPLVDALKENVITEREYDEILSTVIFFTTANYSNLGLNQEKLLNAYNSLSTPLSCMDFINGLQTSTETKAIKAKV